MMKNRFMHSLFTIFLQRHCNTFTHFTFCYCYFVYFTFCVCTVYIWIVVVHWKRSICLCVGMKSRQLFSKVCFLYVISLPLVGQCTCSTFSKWKRFIFDVCVVFDVAQLLFHMIALGVLCLFQCVIVMFLYCCCLLSASSLIFHILFTRFETFTIHHLAVNLCDDNGHMFQH